MHRVSLQALLYLVPVLVLALPLLARRYPGERRLVALACASHGPRPPARARVNPCVRSRAAVPRGGLLIASSLAVRPPPALVVVR
jgi:hypothetical protein